MLGSRRIDRIAARVAESNREIANQAARRARCQDRVVYTSLFGIGILVFLLLIGLFRLIAN